LVKVAEQPDGRDLRPEYESLQAKCAVYSSKAAAHIFALNMGSDDHSIPTLRDAIFRGGFSGEIPIEVEWGRELIRDEPEIQRELSAFKSRVIVLQGPGSRA